MLNITTLTDLRLWVGDRNWDGFEPDERERVIEQIVEAIRTHPDRPDWDAWGWQEYLASLPDPLASLLEDDCPEVKVRIEADMEYNAEEFWRTFRREFPEAAEAIEKHDFADVYLSEWQRIQCLPGFRGGPSYARTALREVE